MVVPRRKARFSLFLVGDKMSPTITVASFFRQITECMRSGRFSQNYLKTGPANGYASKLVQIPPFIYSLLNVRYKTRRDYVPPLNVFFRHCATFLFEFFVVKVSSIIFLIFCNKLDFQKAERVPLSQFQKPCAF